MCVSSRPWPVFEDAFKRHPSLHIHELTLPDMRLFISTRLTENAGYHALRGEEPEYAAQLIEDVAQKASGVFLWVSLVVELLLAAISNGDRITGLQERLKALPLDLEDFFQKILDSQEPEYRQHASQLFQIFRASKSSVSILTLTFADEDTGMILNSPVGPVDHDQLHCKVDRMRRRLNSRCKGLLEVAQRNFSISSEVEYLHRTVKDFMEKESTWARIKAMTPSAFEPNFSLCKSYLIQLKMIKGPDIDGLEELLEEYVYHMSRTRGTAVDTKINALDQLDSTLTFLTSQRRKGNESFLECYALKYPRVQPHWTHVQQLSHETFLPGTFMNFVVSCRFLWYLKAKVSQGVRVKQAEGLASLLFTAIIRYKDSPEDVRNLELDYEIVRFLLEHGADPTESFGGTPLWEYNRSSASLGLSN